MFESMNTSDWVTAASTLVGPILAVQAQKWVERISEKKRSRYQLFSTLMNTRGTQLAAEHVSALNSIDLLFASDKQVISAWRLYYQQLTTPYDTTNQSVFLAWNDKRTRLFVDLLKKIAEAVGAKIDEDRIVGVYHPDGHFERERIQQEIVSNMAAVLGGKQPLKMAVVEFPFEPVMTDSARLPKQRRGLPAETE
ncbi:DUF6680 family protein [Methylocystis echinoides]|uniref:DUF6680 family protein n=1 Tax=Methylocystis echinoides TaxID=29468 RepID=UPI0034330691